MKKLLTGAFVVVGLSVFAMSSCGGDDDDDSKCEALKEVCEECGNDVAKGECDEIAKGTGDAAETKCGSEDTLTLYAATSDKCTAENP